MALVELAVVFTAALLVAWLLSMTSSRVQARLPSQGCFVFVVGLLLALSGDLAKIRDRRLSGRHRRDARGQPGRS